MKLLITLLLLLAAPLAAQTTTRTDSTVARDSIPTAWKVTERTRVVTTITTIVRDSTKPPVSVDTVKPPVPPTVSGCVATDLVCDDFEDGNGYVKNCDQANASGGLAQEGGWCGTIYSETLRKAGTARCGGVGYLSACAATTGDLRSGTTGNMADISLKAPASNIYVRFYTKALTGYRFGAEKVLSVNKGPAGTGGIYFGNLHINCGGSPSATGTLQWQPTAPSTLDRCQTILALTAGRWYYVELHIDLGLKRLEVWADDCTTTCTGTPTRRLLLENYAFNSGTIGSLWWEAWSNPSTTGERLIDKVKVDTKFIGFAK